MVFLAIFFSISACFEQNTTIDTYQNTNSTASTNRNETLGTTPLPENFIPQTPAGYQLIWSDEFNTGTKPDIKKWNIDTGYGSNGWGNDEWQNYTNQSTNVAIENGNLVLSAHCTSNCGKRNGSITSGKITTQKKFSVKFGNIQARIKMPSGLGMWPAFWMLGENIDDDGWPRSGEIDIVEMGYRYWDVYTTSAAAHYDDSGHKYTTATKKFNAPLTDGFHVFEVEWTEDMLTVKIDGLAYYSLVFDFVKHSEFLNDYFLLLNLAVGGTLGGDVITNSWPQKMLIDWVRVYQTIPDKKKIVFAEPSGVTKQEFKVIINTYDWGGNSVTTDLSSNGVTPLEGSKVLAATYTDQSKGWGGLVFKFNRDDWSDYAQLQFSIDTSALADFNDLEVKLEDNRGETFAKSVQLASYMPVISNNWSIYNIPLIDLVGVDLTDVIYLGFYNPKDVNDVYLAGMLYFDDIHLNKITCTTPGSLAFDAASYAQNASKASVTLTDICGANKRTVVSLNNGSDVIAIGVVLDAAGKATVEVKFATSSDVTKSLAVQNGYVLTASFKDVNGNIKTTSSSITTPTL